MLFIKNPRKSFHVSAENFYVLGKKESPSRFMTRMRPYLSRPGYRSRSSGNLVAL